MDDLDRVYNLFKPVGLEIHALEVWKKTKKSRQEWKYQNKIFVNNKQMPQKLQS